MLRRFAAAKRFAHFLWLMSCWPLLRRREWLLVWVVNAGRREDVLAFCPEWMARLGARWMTVMPISKMTAHGHGVALVVGSPLSNEDLESSREACQRVVTAVSRLSAHRIALNGILPAALHAHELWSEADQRIVSDQLGTVYMIADNVREARERHSEAWRDRPVVAVFGVGHTGARVARHLAERGLEVLAFDARVEAGARLDPAVEFLGDDYSGVRRASIVVLLTSRGDDGVASLREHLRSGTVIISDTHPKVSKRVWADLHARGMIGYESSLFMEKSRFSPKIPMWNRDSVPGCVGQALVESVKETKISDVSEFAEAAHQVGLGARLDRPGPVSTPHASVSGDEG